ncbi:hypothetical protein [Streptomyces sp. NPDC093089]|uniref:hypothetical protein n=1 Tax=Streptomyces sp. NPDC093089 TaxID=3366024 RepID=UPI00381F6444
MGRAPISTGTTCPARYCIQAAVAEPDEEAKGTVVPISLTVDVSGTPRAGNGPVFSFGDESAQGPSPSAPNGDGEQGGNGNGEQGRTGVQGGSGDTAVAAEDDDPLMGGLALPLGIGAAVLLLGGVAFYVLRRGNGA